MGYRGSAVHLMVADTDLSVCVARADRLRGSQHTGIYHQTRSFACARWLAARGTMATSSDTPSHCSPTCPPARGCTVPQTSAARPNDFFSSSLQPPAAPVLRRPRAPRQSANAKTWLGQIALLEQELLDVPSLPSAAKREMANEVRCWSSSKMPGKKEKKGLTLSAAPEAR